MTVEPPITEDITVLTEPPTDQQETVGIARAAVVIGAGNVASRVLGLVREQVKSYFFGTMASADAFIVATLVPTMLHDLLIGGMVDSALVPVFSAYAKEDRDELWRLVSVLLSLTVVVMAVFILLVTLFAPQIVRAADLLGSGTLDPAFFDLAAGLMRITIPAVLFLSLSGILSALLYALKRFTWPAFTAAVFNAGIVGMTLLLQSTLDIRAMAIGWLTGAILQVGLLLPGLRGTRIWPTLRLYHPAIRQVLKLYLPIAIGLLAEIALVRPISYGLALQTGEGGLSAMTYATTLRQLPQGLVGIAISFAILPTLSQHAADLGDAAFRRTLARGLRLASLLIIPATVGLFVLGQPTVELLLEHGAFTAYDTQITTVALYFYLVGLPFAALDLLLVFAFYARQDTLTPALIGIGSNVAMMIVAFALFEPLGLFSLMIADSFKQLLHTAIAAYLLRRQVGGLAEHGVARTILIALGCSAIMAVAVYAALAGVRAVLAPGILLELTAVAVPGALGAGLYLWLVTRFGVEEFGLLWDAVRRRFTQTGG
ncbi:MAG: murein biosynthesis integral membrane protein MurJ [Chloroflexi bacterium]|nr:murein biosynthesis integral membrane protein MurJ [Chloroflexota bacterium]